MLQNTIAFPGSVQVAALVTTSTSVCGDASISSWDSNTLPQTEQWLPEVFPGFSQVASSASSVTIVWPVAGISFSSVRILLQLLQYTRAFPGSSQVAALVTTSTSV